MLGCTTSGPCRNVNLCLWCPVVVTEHICCIWRSLLLGETSWARPFSPPLSQLCPKRRAEHFPGPDTTGARYCGVTPTCPTSKVYSLRRLFYCAHLFCVCDRGLWVILPTLGNKNSWRFWSSLPISCSRSGRRRAKKERPRHTSFHPDTRRSFHCSKVSSTSRSVVSPHSPCQRFP